MDDSGPEEEPEPSAESPIRLGWIEQARVFPGGLNLHAKLDSGAKGTSISAVNPRFFKRAGREWVRFKVTNRVGDSAVFERKVIETVEIKRFLGRKLTRPVIRLTICLGSVKKEMAVSLQDRTGFGHQLLIGRPFMAGRILIDPSAKFISSQTCPNGATQ